MGGCVDRNEAGRGGVSGAGGWAREVKKLVFEVGIHNNG
jgi:hypothetical protein